MLALENVELVGVKTRKRQIHLTRVLLIMYIYIFLVDVVNSLVMSILTNYSGDCKYNNCKYL